MTTHCSKRTIKIIPIKEGRASACINTLFLTSNSIIVALARTTEQGLLYYNVRATGAVKSYTIRICFSSSRLRQLLKASSIPQKHRLHFVKIILRKNDNFDLTLRKWLFCNAKPTLLPCKTAAFAMQNNRFCNALIERELYNSYYSEILLSGKT